MKALVIGSSGGIGRAMTDHLRVDGRFDTVAALSRSADGLDITDEASVAAAAHRMSQMHGTFDLIINATGALTISSCRCRLPLPRFCPIRRCGKRT